MTVLKGVLKNAFGEVMPNHTIILVSLKNTQTVLNTVISEIQTDDNGKYEKNIYQGKYQVEIFKDGQQKTTAGIMVIYADSPSADINTYLTLPGESEITPEALVQFIELKNLAVQASDSANAAKENVEENAQKAESAAVSAKLSQDESKKSESNSKSSAESAEQSNVSSKSNLDSIQILANQVSSDAASASQSKDDAEESAQQSAISESEASGHAAAAKQSEDNAKSYADSINPDSLVTKSFLQSSSGASGIGTSMGKTAEDLLKNSYNSIAIIENFSHLKNEDDWSDAIQAAFDTGLEVMGDGTYNASKIFTSKGQKIIGSFNVNTTRYGLGVCEFKTEQPDTESIRMLYLESAYDLSELMFIKKLGFNMINHYCTFANNGDTDAAGTVEKLLDNALTAGLRVNIATESPRAIADLAEFINATKNHPATFGYSVYDEPSARNISIADQQSKLNTIRSLTDKNLNFVDLLTVQPFNDRFAKGYDLAFIDSYSVNYSSGNSAEWLKKDLAKMRYDFGGIKAMTGLECIPVISAFTDTTPATGSAYYSQNLNQVISASKIFGKVAEGNFGAFVWDGESAKFPNTVRKTQALKDLVSAMASQRKRKKLDCEVFLFGGVSSSTKWPISGLLNKIAIKDPNTTLANVAGGSWPTRILAGSSDTDHSVVESGADYSGIAYKTSFSNLCTTIKCRKNVRVLCEIFNFRGSMNGKFSLYGTKDGGYTFDIIYEDEVKSNKVVDFNSDLPDSRYDDHLIIRLENSGDGSQIYNKVIRGFIGTFGW